MTFPVCVCLVQELLDEAQAQLVEGAARLCMPVQLIRKTRSVGVVPTQATIYEVGAVACFAAVVPHTNELPGWWPVTCQSQQLCPGHSWRGVAMHQYAHAVLPALCVVMLTSPGHCCISCAGA